MPPSLPTTLLLAMLIATSASSHAQEPAAGVVAVLDLTVNTVNHGEIRVILDGDDVWADVAALEAAGLRRFGGMRRRVGDRAVREAGVNRPATAGCARRGGADADAHGRRDALRPDDAAIRLGPSGRHPPAAGAERVSQLRRDVGDGQRPRAEPRRRRLCRRDAPHLFVLPVSVGRPGTRPHGRHRRRSLAAGSLSGRRRVRRHGPARRLAAAGRRVGVAGLLARPVLHPLSDNRPRRRGDDAVAHRPLREQPASAIDAGAAWRVRAGEPRPADRRRRHPCRGARRLWRTAGVRWLVLRHDQRARQGAAAVSIRVRRRTPAAVRHALELRRPGVHGRPSHRADEQRHARRAGRIGVGSCLRRPDDVRAGRTARRDRVERCRKPIRRRRRARCRHRLRIRRPSRKRLARMAAGERHLSDADHAPHGRRADARGERERHRAALRTCHARRELAVARDARHDCRARPRVARPCRLPSASPAGCRSSSRRHAAASTGCGPTAASPR